MNEKDYEALVDLFATPGWKHFISGVTELEESLTRGAVESATTNEAWQYTRGQVGQLRAILGYENFVTLAWQQKQENDRQENANADPV